MFAQNMSNAACTNCGAALVMGAKFCRQCGRLVEDVRAQSVTEATTRTLHTPPGLGAQPTDFIGSQPTGAAYLAPNEVPPPPAYNTNSLEPRGRKRNVWLISSMVALVLASLIAFGIILYFKTRTSATTKVPVPKQPTVDLPGIPPPPPPPVPKSSTGPSGATAINPDFIYPGAATTMELTSANGESLLQLRTKDSYEKVLDWYVAKLKPVRTVKGPQNAVLKSDKIMAILNGTGDGTNIMLKETSDIDMDEDR